MLPAHWPSIEISPLGFERTVRKPGPVGTGAAVSTATALFAATGVAEAAEQGLELDLLGLFLKLGEHVVGFVAGGAVVGFLRQLVHRAHVVEPAEHVLERVDRGLEDLQFGNDGPGLLRLVPEAGLAHLRFELLSAVLLFREVKESPGWRSSGPKETGWRSAGCRGSWVENCTSGWREKQTQRMDGVARVLLRFYGVAGPRKPDEHERSKATEENVMSIQLKPLDEQVIVIMGASSGIGLATAETAVQKGAKVVLAARSVETLNQVVNRMNAGGGERAIFIACRTM